MSTYPAEGSLSDLSALLRRLRMLADTRDILTDLGYSAEAARIERDRGSLAAHEITLTHWCLAHEGEFPVTWTVGEVRGLPHREAVCGACSVRAEHEAGPDLRLRPSQFRRGDEVLGGPPEHVKAGTVASIDFVTGGVRVHWLEGGHSVYSGRARLNVRRAARHEENEEQGS